jgi:hypothetical protein
MAYLIRDDDDGKLLGLGLLEFENIRGIDIISDSEKRTPLSYFYVCIHTLYHISIIS